MPKILWLTSIPIIAALAVASPNATFSKYKPVQTYEIRPGILMIPTFAEDGEVCEIGLERRHYSPDIIRLESTLSRKEIETMAEELAPTAERGPKTEGVLGEAISMSGGGITTDTEYENVSVTIYSKVLASSKKGGIVADDIAATIKWKHHPCK